MASHLYKVYTRPATCEVGLYMSACRPSRADDVGFGREKQRANQGIVVDHSRTTLSFITRGCHGRQAWG